MSMAIAISHRGAVYLASDTRVSVAMDGEVVSYIEAPKLRRELGRWTVALRNKHGASTLTAHDTGLIVWTETGSPTVRVPPRIGTCAFRVAWPRGMDASDTEAAQAALGRALATARAGEDVVAAITAAFRYAGACSAAIGADIDIGITSGGERVTYRLSAEAPHRVAASSGSLPSLQPPPPPQVRHRQTPTRPFSSGPRSGRSLL